MAERGYPFVIRTLLPHDWPKHRVARLRALADSPDAFGSTLAQAQERAPEAWAARLAEAAVSGKDYPLIAEIDGEPAGLAWAMVSGSDPVLVELFQVWVAPEARGRGIAAALLQEVTRWARTTGAAAIQLDVTCGDTAAVRLYRRAGFQEIGAPAPFREGSALLSQVMRLALDAGAPSTVPQAPL